MFDPISTVQTALTKMIKGITGSDVTLGLVFLGLWMYRRSRLKKGANLDPDAPRISGANLNFIAQTPEDEAKLKTMHCDDCGFTIYVAKNRFKLHFKDGLRCLNCGAVAPVFYNQNDPNDPLNKEGATIEDFQEEEYFASELNATELNAMAMAAAAANGTEVDPMLTVETSESPTSGVADDVLPEPAPEIAESGEEPLKKQEDILLEVEPPVAEKEAESAPPVAEKEPDVAIPITEKQIEEVVPEPVAPAAEKIEEVVEAAPEATPPIAEKAEEVEEAAPEPAPPIAEEAEKYEEEPSSLPEKEVTSTLPQIVEPPQVVVVQDDVPDKEPVAAAASETAPVVEEQKETKPAVKPKVKPGDPVPSELSVFKDFGVL